jgi:16S rRNA (adenine1518-N6/adenine1519-N6)-dimethyltransferase
MKHTIKAKKHLGQHFLNNQTISKNIVDALTSNHPTIEVGPGTGVLTHFLLEKDYKLYLSEVDVESIAYLVEHLEVDKSQFLGDFLHLNLKEVMGTQPFNVIGNFPYNISSQILFRVFENKEQVIEVVGMFQKEVAERIASKPGSKKYGILSVLLQAFYDIEYLFTVGPEEFTPPPKVQSGAIRLVRNNTTDLGCDERLFKQVIKTAFNLRRKTIRNSIKSLIGDNKDFELLNKRPEQLSVKEFVDLTNYVQSISE